MPEVLEDIPDACRGKAPRREVRQVTAPDPRVGEIEARLGEIGARIRACIPYNFGLRHADKLAHEDAPYLLAELRKAQEALGRVEAVATDLATRGAAIEAKGYNGSINSNINEGRSIGYLEGARLIRAAVAAAKGDGE